MVRESIFARHLEGDARRNVRLDEAGDHVDRRTLRGEDQVDAGRARLLREARDQLLDLLAGDHHQVGELVDHDHDAAAAPRAAPGLSGVSENGFVSGLPRLARLGALSAL